MTKRFDYLQRMLVLAHALNSVIDSDEFVSSIERIRKNTIHTKDTNSDLNLPLLKIQINPKASSCSHRK